MKGSLVNDEKKNEMQEKMRGIAEARSKQSMVQAEVWSRQTVDKAREEAEKAREEAKKAKEKARKAKEEKEKRKAEEDTKKAREEAEKAREDAEKARQEAKRAKEEAEGVDAGDPEPSSGSNTSWLSGLPKLQWLRGDTKDATGSLDKSSEKISISRSDQSASPRYNLRSRGKSAPTSSQSILQPKAQVRTTKNLVENITTSLSPEYTFDGPCQGKLKRTYPDQFYTKDCTLSKSKRKKINAWNRDTSPK